MRVSEFLRVVEDQLPAGYGMEVLGRDEYLAVILVKTGAPNSHFRATLTYTGHEMLILDLDDRFRKADGAVEDDDLKEVTSEMIDIACAFLRGEGRVSEGKGILGRYEQLDITAAGRAYRGRFSRIMSSWEYVLVHDSN